jgi:hypothetical protein
MSIGLFFIVFFLLLYHTEQYEIEYENGETEVVECKRLEPEGDFVPPEVGSGVCCKTKGAKYSAVILHILEKSNEVRVCIATCNN